MGHTSSKADGGDGLTPDTKAWLLAEDDKRFVYQLNEQGTNHFTFQVNTYGLPPDQRRPEAERIARIAYAAPDLLATLADLGRECGHCEWWHADSCTHWEARDECHANCRAARQAIAKARGE